MQILLKYLLNKFLIQVDEKVLNLRNLIMLNFIKSCFNNLSELTESMVIKCKSFFPKVIPLVERVLRGYLIFTIIVLIFLKID
jgi:hypothetical protein